jgi:elongation factor Ts
MTITELVKAKISELGENIVIRRFTRYMVGEGIADEPAGE